ncbi:hypothetical protein D3C72_1057620 [compost metagenome]
MLINKILTKSFKTLKDFSFFINFAPRFRVQLKTGDLQFSNLLIHVKVFSFSFRRYRVYSCNLSFCYRTDCVGPFGYFILSDFCFSVFP